MALHQDIPSMLRESLPEMLLVAKYCIEYRKDSNIWPAPGCYGYPAALLLLSIVDSIGSYVEGGNVKNHFKILNNSNYYGLDLTGKELDLIFDHYRNTLSHNSVVTPKVMLSIGTENGPVLQKYGGKYLLNLAPFYNVSVKAVKHFLNKPEILMGNQTISDNHKKR
jgi:hypothetical protein